MNSNIYETTKDIFKTPIVFNIVSFLNKNLEPIQDNNEFAEKCNTYFHVNEELEDMKKCGWEVTDIVKPSAPIYYIIEEETMSKDDILTALHNLKDKALGSNNLYLSFSEYNCPQSISWDEFCDMIDEVFMDTAFIIIIHNTAE